MDYFTWWLAIAVFFHQFQSPGADDETENRYTKKSSKSRCKNRPPKCRSTLGQETPKCEKDSKIPCLKDRTVFESLDGEHVLCDTKTDGGGWIIIQRRITGDVEFANKTWAQYRDGFGSFDGDLWIGNAMIRKLTVAGYTDMRVDMKWKGHTYYATYKNYKVEDEANFYRLTYNGFRGSTRLDDMMGSIGMPFSTVDVHSVGCTLWYGRTGWWWRTLDRWCGSANLNGIWAKTAYGQGIYWDSITHVNTSLDFVEMKLRKPSP